MQSFLSVALWLYFSQSGGNKIDACIADYMKKLITLRLETKPQRILKFKSVQLYL